MHGGRSRGVVLIFGVVAHALDLMVPEATRKKLEPMEGVKVRVGVRIRVRELNVLIPKRVWDCGKEWVYKGLEYRLRRR